MNWLELTFARWDVRLTLKSDVITDSHWADMCKKLFTLLVPGKGMKNEGLYLKIHMQKAPLIPS